MMAAGEVLATIDAIVDRGESVADGQPYYLVQWAGIDPATSRPWQPTWEPSYNLVDIEELVLAFESKLLLGTSSWLAPECYLQYGTGDDECFSDQDHVDIEEPTSFAASRPSIDDSDSTQSGIDDDNVVWHSVADLPTTFSTIGQKGQSASSSSTTNADAVLSNVASNASSSLDDHEGVIEPRRKKRRKHRPKRRIEQTDSSSPPPKHLPVEKPVQVVAASALPNPVVKIPRVPSATKAPIPKIIRAQVAKKPAVTTSSVKMPKDIISKRGKSSSSRDVMSAENVLTKRRTATVSNDVPVGMVNHEQIAQRIAFPEHASSSGNRRRQTFANRTPTIQRRDFRGADLSWVETSAHLGEIISTILPANRHKLIEHVLDSFSRSCLMILVVETPFLFIIAEWFKSALANNVLLIRSILLLLYRLPDCSNPNFDNFKHILQSGTILDVMCKRLAKGVLDHWKLIKLYCSPIPVIPIVADVSVVSRRAVNPATFREPHQIQSQVRSSRDQGSRVSVYRDEPYQRPPPLAELAEPHRDTNDQSGLASLPLENPASMYGSGQLQSRHEYRAIPARPAEPASVQPHSRALAPAPASAQYGFFDSLLDLMADLSVCKVPVWPAGPNEADLKSVPCQMYFFNQIQTCPDGDKCRMSHDPRTLDTYQFAW